MKHILSSVKLLIVISVFLACYSCNQLPSHDQLTEEIVVDPALDSLFIWLNKNNMFNGAVAIKKEGKLLLKKGYGFANYHRNDRFQSSTSMEIASVSKQFTATAIALLIQEGKIGLEDTVKKYLGEDFPYEGVTIKNLVTHTSGIPDYEDYFKQIGIQPRLLPTLILFAISRLKNLGDYYQGSIITIQIQGIFYWPKL